jgi:hypothetical protein
VCKVRTQRLPTECLPLRRQLPSYGGDTVCFTPASSPGFVVVASYGLELVEIGGTPARHVDDGDEVRTVVLLARAEAGGDR